MQLKDCKSIYKIEGNGGIDSKYKSFIDEANNKAFNTAFIQLQKSNQVFNRVYSRLYYSKTTYKVQQYYQTSLSSEAAYNPSQKTVKLFYDGASKEAIFEEFLHAGQDDYYKEKGMKRSSLANEVEAKAANLFLEYKDESINKNDYSSIKKWATMIKRRTKLKISHLLHSD
ncbi:hypothetical protein A4H97_21465 [Niastella yeongjuensis]|uniref:Uncharacterized protein n=1 Tax=Niastella yeongjuensis TaxID=354355 RepID=A0A1V9F8E2_9BACT|nr:hypothetical protein [Niastella yeongjuensis]OQP54541.1 hypothetical protein A4H97_21465 [Niastella yeongjuensis]SEN98318.1 hypothetical protein SAMN05660816_01806 [Niastella yeongjuensis]